MVLWATEEVIATLSAIRVNLTALARKSQGKATADKSNCGRVSAIFSHSVALAEGGLFDKFDDV